MGGSANELADLVRRITGAEIPNDWYGQPAPFSLGYWTRVAGLDIRHGDGSDDFEAGWLGADIELAREKLETTRGEERRQTDPAATQPSDA